MIDTEYADAYFGEHPSGATYFGFAAAARAAALAVARRDIHALLGREAEGPDDDAFAAAAVCEQALFCLLHPELFTESETPPRLVSEAVNGIGRRSYDRRGSVETDPRRRRFAPRALEYLETILGGSGPLRFRR